jgi:predicted ATP-grasp superfamily ATP-dependent carboligase
MKAIGYRGVLDIGYKFDRRTGLYKTIDANPRIGRTFRLLVDSAGMDVVRALYLDLTGQPVQVGEAREGRKWVVENFDLISAPQYCRHERLSVSEWLRSYKEVEETFWFSRDDLAPFGAMLWHGLQWGCGKLLAKVHAVSLKLWRSKAQTELLQQHRMANALEVLSRDRPALSLVSRG